MKKIIYLVVLLLPLYTFAHDENSLITAIFSLFSQCPCLPLQTTHHKKLPTSPLPSSESDDSSDDETKGRLWINTNRKKHFIKNEKSNS